MIQPSLLDGVRTGFGDEFEKKGAGGANGGFRNIETVRGKHHDPGVGVLSAQDIDEIAFVGAAYLALVQHKPDARRHWGDRASGRCARNIDSNNSGAGE